MIYKFSNTEISISSANVVYGSPLVRCVNPTTGVVNCTVSVNSSVNLYSFSIRANSEIIVEKGSNNLIQGTGVVASPVGYRN
jgi:hypothetical protein